MGKYLLDTHALIWFQDDFEMLSATTLKILGDSNNEIFYSQINLFEIAIKQKIKKLPDFDVSIEEILQRGMKDSFILLSILNSHIDAYHEVPLFDDHRDPFDRLLIATAMVENMPIISIDKNFRRYSSLISVIW